MPSFIFIGQTQFSCLYPVKARFFRLLVFSVVLYLFTTWHYVVTSYPINQLSVFLGYSCTQQGYHFYNLVTRRYYVSVNIIFFEDTPYCSTTNCPLLTPHVAVPLPTSVLPSSPLQTTTSMDPTFSSTPATPHAIPTTPLSFVPPTSPSTSTPPTSTSLLDVDQYLVFHLLLLQLLLLHLLLLFYLSPLIGISSLFFVKASVLLTLLPYGWLCLICSSWALLL